MRCAKIENGVVVNIIVFQDPALASALWGGQWILIPEGIDCGIGWTVIDGQFIAPEEEE